MSCIFCSLSTGKLTKLTTKGLQAITSVSLQRNDTIHLGFIDSTQEFLCHANCRLLYIKNKNTDKCLPDLRKDKAIKTDLHAFFDYSKSCVICTLSFIGRKDIHANTNPKLLLDICENNKDKFVRDVQTRIMQANVNHTVTKYHGKCYRSFTHQYKLTKTMLTSKTSGNTISTRANVSLSNETALIINNNSSATSDREHLYNIAHQNNLTVKSTVGGGNCFYHAVQQALVDLHKVETISSLRTLVANELKINHLIYRHLYIVDDDGANNYDTFVANTTLGNEWATELTISALARALNVAISVLSTSVDNNGHVTAFECLYDDDVSNTNDSIRVGYISSERHYVALCLPNNVLSASSSYTSTNTHADQHHTSNQTMSQRTSITDMSQMNCPLNHTSNLIMSQQTSISNMPVLDFSTILASVAVNPITELGSINSIDLSSSSDVIMSVDSAVDAMVSIDDDLSLVDVTACLDSANQINNVNSNQTQVMKQCSNCKRVEHVNCLLDLHEFQGEFVARRVKLLSPKEHKYILCSLCAKYLRTNVRSTQFWQCGWPSVIAYVLSNPKYKNFSKTMWDLLPQVHRDSWQLHVLNNNFNSNTSACFDDFTKHLARWNELKTSGNIADFIAANTEYAFPCVKCPAGCFAYVDECSFVQFHHFLNWKYDIAFYNADSDYLKGARQDWPTTSVQLDVFHVKPGLVVHEEKGLCIMVCNGHGKSGLTKPIIHVPLNPVLGDDGFQSPDTLAAAILTPNVIRAGRMGKWTNSSHVIAAIGGYTGISSSSLAEKLDCTVQDYRLSASSYLAADHRADVRNTLVERFFAIQNAEEEFQRGLDIYNKYYKPSIDHERSSVSGATFVEVANCFTVNENFASRDVSSNGLNENMASLSLIFVHSSNAGGCKPIDLTDFVKQQKHVLTDLLLNVLIHCPTMYTALVKSYDDTKNKYLGKLLHFVHYVCKHSNRRKSRFVSADDCESQTHTQLANYNLSASDPVVAVAKLLDVLSSEFDIKNVSVVADLDDFLFNDNVSAVIVLRNTGRRWPHALPNRIGEFFLAFVLHDSKTRKEFQFRWNENFSFWFVQRDKGKQVSAEVNGTDSLVCSHWKMLVYVRSCNTKFISKQLEMGLRGQRMMRCADHEIFLAKQPVHCTVDCCVNTCTRKARWCCTGRGSPCPHAVCLSHGEAIIRGDVVVDVECGMMGRRLRRVQNDEAELLEEETSVHENFTENDDGEDTVVLLPLGVDAVDEEDCGPPMHSRKDIIPVYEVNRHMPSHFLWNNKYNVMKRTNGVCSNVRTNAILEHIVAVSGNACVSLLYPEAQLFPRIFWHSRLESVSGAIPSFVLNRASSGFGGLASLAEHLHVRLRDGDVLTAKENCYWHYVFDILLNNALCGTSAQLVFRRGLEFLAENNEQAFNGQPAYHQPRMPMDETEAVRRVKELASLLKKGKWHYFLTITVNDYETPGIREITKAIHKYAGDDAEKLQSLTNAFLPVLLRAWERFVRLLLQELVMRNDNIIGKVKNLFYRFEFQGAGAKGNKPHVYCGITLDNESESVSVSRICCSSLSFHSQQYGTDFDSLKKLGVINSQNDYNQWIDIVSCVNHHDCSKTQFRCMKATNAEGEKVCRYHKQPPLPITSTNGSWFEPIVMPYPQEAYELLEEVGLATRLRDNVAQCDTWAVDECLSAGKWHYYARQDEFFLSSIPLLSAICRSSTNVDMCDKKFQVSYLVKYVAGKEEHQLVNVAGTAEITEVTITTEEHAHEKITNCGRLVATKERKNPHQGREISLAEVVWFNLGFTYTYCTADFVHVPTVPLENRIGVLHKHSQSSAVTSASKVLTTVELRSAASLPRWRQFTDSQLAHMEDYSKSPYCLDTTSAFNIRPPELLIFDELAVYSEMFIAIGKQNTIITAEVSVQPWFDGASRRIKIKSSCVLQAVAIVAAKAADGNEAAKTMFDSVFKLIQDGNAKSVSMFVHHNTDRDTVAVVSFVKPWDKAKFVTHLCLTLGRYATENDIFCCRDMKTAFYNCGLLQSPTDQVTRADILAILRKYIVRDLVFHPISARQFAKYLKAAEDTLNEVLINGVLADYCPCLSNVMLKDQANDLVKNREENRKKKLLEGLLDDIAIRDSLPHGLDSASLDNPLSWVPAIVQAEGISNDAYTEQTAALLCCVKAIDNFLQPMCRGVKFPCLVGRPGSGKSHVLKIAAAYALSKGLSVELLSWTSERARKLGGNHLHLVFPLPVNTQTVTYSSGIASDCLSRLERDPVKRAVLKRTDVFVFEEIGMLSAEYFAALDNILRVIMANSMPWGGKLLMCCGDGKQLPPIDGRPIWTSANMCTMMNVFVFTADVRARDPHLQWLNDQCRRQLSTEECEAVTEVVLRECNFRESWTNVPQMAVRIVSTKAAEQQVTEKFLEDKQTMRFVAVDEVQNGAVWQTAGARVTKRLNKNCYEYDVCHLYTNAIVRMTYNERQGQHQFSQGQVAVVVELPVEGTSFLQQRIRLRLAPPGIRDIDVGKIPTRWPEIVIGPRTTQPSVVGAFLQMGRRTQFPVRYYVCSTIHRIQGETVPMLATQLSNTEPQYRLWQKEQFIVLVSRVQRCRDIFFVGTPTETKRAIIAILDRSSKWDALVDNYLSVLNVATRPSGMRELLLDSHPYLPLYRELPTTKSGYVYMLVSIARPNRYYIGETDDLRTCLCSHNTGYGTKETRDTTLHPWGVFAFVVGFECSRCELSQEYPRYSASELCLVRKEFVEAWTCCDSRNGLEQVYEAGKQIANQWLVRGFSLTVVKCGELRRQRPNETDVAM